MWGPVTISVAVATEKKYLVGYIVKMAAEEQDVNMEESTASKEQGGQKMFTLKKWNAVAMWSWDVECDTCAICRVQVMDACLRCQSDNKQEECVVVWGECNHSFHNCCMSLWVVQNNRCPLCQQEWVVQRIGR